MDIDPQNFFQVLREYSKDQIKGPAECQRLVTILNYNLTEEQLNASLIGNYMLLFLWISSKECKILRQRVRSVCFKYIHLI